MIGPIGALEPTDSAWSSSMRYRLLMVFYGASASAPLSSRALSLCAEEGIKGAIRTVSIGSRGGGALCATVSSSSRTSGDSNDDDDPPASKRIIRLTTFHPPPPPNPTDPLSIHSSPRENRQCAQLSTRSRQRERESEKVYRMPPLSQIALLPNSKSHDANQPMEAAFRRCRFCRRRWRSLWSQSPQTLWPGSGGWLLAPLGGSRAGGWPAGSRPTHRVHELETRTHSLAHKFIFRLQFPNQTSQKELCRRRRCRFHTLYYYDNDDHDDEQAKQSQPLLNGQISLPLIVRLCFTQSVTTTTTPTWLRECK